MATNVTGAPSLFPQTASGSPFSIALPPSRWRTRLLPPALIALAIAGLFGYSAGGLFTSAIPVWVVPVVPKLKSNESAAEKTTRDSSPTFLAQAPGWIEPDPYAINVPALAEGVISEVMVLEGQQVAAGQVVARLVDEDARLAQRFAEAQLEALRAEVEKKQADLHVAEARAAEIEDQLARDRPLASRGGIATGELARQEFRLKAAQHEAASGGAAIAVAKANVRQQEVTCEQARLTLKRMEITSPSAGTVLARLVEPGSRISMQRGTLSGSGESMSGTVIRLYDPAKLQVRVDVPLADSGKISIGAVAEIVTEALPEETIRGRVSRLVHEANIQRNTVQVKVAIEDPPNALKPEMLTRVRFYSPVSAAQDSSTTPTSNAVISDDASGMSLLVPEAALIGARDESARVWLVENTSKGANQTAILREVKLGKRGPAGYAHVLAGLRPGDRVIVSPHDRLRPGARIRVLGEASESSLRGEVQR